MARMPERDGKQQVRQRRTFLFPAPASSAQSPNWAGEHGPKDNGRVRCMRVKGRGGEQRCRKARKERWEAGCALHVARLHVQSVTTCITPFPMYSEEIRNKTGRKGVAVGGHAREFLCAPRGRTPQASQLETRLAENRKEWGGGEAADAFRTKPLAPSSLSLDRTHFRNEFNVTDVRTGVTRNLREGRGQEDFAVRVVRLSGTRRYLLALGKDRSAPLALRLVVPRDGTLCCCEYGISPR